MAVFSKVGCTLDERNPRASCKTCNLHESQRWTSGQSCWFFKITPEEILLVLDDFALPLGRLRIRKEGSSGGHNGLESVLTQFGTKRIPRLRLGIGGAPSEGAIDYVLGRFFEEERDLKAKTVARACEAVKCAIDKGLLSAMNIFNQAQET